VRRSGYERLLRRAVIVNCSDQSAYRGVVWGEGRQLLFLASVTFYENPASPGRDVDGVISIPKEKIQFIQLPSGV
jgi:hypothetical protein